MMTIEFYSLIIKKEAVNYTFTNKYEFFSLIPNDSMEEDDYYHKIVFMNEGDLMAFEDVLISYKLTKTDYTIINVFSGCFWELKDLYYINYKVYNTSETQKDT